MARHEVTIHENAGATKAKAPYLGNYISKETLHLEQFSESVAAKCGLPKIQVEAILGGAFDAIAELERDSLVRVHTHLGVVCGVIRGSFPTSDAPFDPARNSLVLALRLWDDLKLDLVDVTPAIITDSSLTKLRVDNAMDIAVQKPMNLIHGNHVFRVAGFNMVLSDAGAAVYLQNALGTTFRLVIDRIVTHQLFEAHTAELLPAGDYKFVVKSRAGDAEGPLQTSFRRVKYMRVEDPAPSLTVTGVHNEETEPPNIYVGRSLLFDGTGLDAWGDGDRIEVKRLGDGETDWESITGTDDVTVSAQDGMLWVSTDWWSAISFGVEEGTEIRFRVTIGGTSAETTGTVHEE